MEYLPSLNSGANLRNSFEDIEVNEGRWLMEGTANYLKNINLSDHQQDHYKTYSFSISNLVDNSELKMNGSELTSVFDNLISQISDEEIATGTKAIVADIDLLSISDVESSLLFKVLYGKGNPTVEAPFSMISWIDASYTISTNCNVYLADLRPEDPACSIFYPEALIYLTNSAEWNGPDCTSDGSVCLSSATLSDPNINSYNSDWIGDINSGDTKKFLDVCQDIVDNINYNSEEGSALSHPFIISSVLSGAVIDEIGDEPNQEHFYYHIVNGVVGFSYEYCYQD